MTATEVKATLLAVLDRVRAGEEVLITKRGAVVARLLPVPDHATLRGSMAETARSTVSDDELFSTGQVWAAS